MSRLRIHTERHSINRIGWLRAAVLGANAGIVSTGSLIVGVAASNQARADVLIAGIAALIAGAMSMAAGEYVSVSSQADSERANLARERQELADDPAFEEDELTQIYVARGLNEPLARQVAVQLMAGDALAAHARDELGLSDLSAARPLQAALASAATFTAGALAPLLVSALVAPDVMIAWVSSASIASLALLGALGAFAGSAPIFPSVVRITFWGAVALVVTAGIGRLVGASL